ncbi:MAG: NUDIX hydrolase [Anaerolineae bacterium]|nr:NUDIX hydrolase [Anaerolineae bacterium]
MKPKRLARTVVYENPWVNLYIDRVQFPGGRIIEQHHLLDFEKEAVGVLVENERDKILLVHAYRYTTDTIEWEIPTGGIENGEAILAAAAREVWEESGYETVNHQLIYTYYPQNGISNQVFHIACCRATAKTGIFDKNEVREIKWVSQQQIREMIGQKLIKDGFSLTALLLHFSQLIR